MENFNVNDFEIIQYKSNLQLQAYKIIFKKKSAGKISLKKDIIEGAAGWYLSIELNQKSRNKGLGKFAVIDMLYKFQGESLYANVRKNNKPSRKILEALNFKVFKITASGQLIYKYNPIKYDSEIFSNINWEEYYKSVLVDIVVFLANPTKLAVRIPYKKDEYNVLDLLIQFCEVNHFYYFYDEFYIIISKLDNAQYIYDTDLMTQKHIKEFGRLLGYPECCTNFMDCYEETEIDTIEELIRKERTYEGNYILNDLSGYYQGIALISHIPCSCSCNYSLISALLTGLYIKENKTKVEGNEFSNLELFIDKRSNANVKL